MSVAYPKTISHPVALRARLAAFMALMLLVTGLFGHRPVPPPAAGALGRVETVAAWRFTPVQPRSAVTRARPESRVGDRHRSRLTPRRGARYEDARHRGATVAWPDMEMGAPTVARFFFRKIPSADGADADADHPHAPLEGYHSRAPPTLA